MLGANVRLINTNLNRKTHVNEVCKKESHFVGIINSLKSRLPNHIALAIAKKGLQND